MAPHETDTATPNRLAPPPAGEEPGEGRSDDTGPGDAGSGDTGSGDTGPGDAGRGAAGPGGPPGIAWERRVSFLFNIDTWYDFTKVFLIVVGVWAVITTIAVALGASGMFGVLPIVALILLVIAVGTILLMALLYPRGWQMRFSVAGDGITHSQKLVMAGIFRPIVAVLGFVAWLQGRPTGDISEAGDSGTVTWKEVHKVKFSSRRHVAVAMGKWNCAVRVYCPPEQWDAVVARLRAGEAEGRRTRGE